MTDDWNPQGIDTHTPSTARMYDYFLGGKDNFAVDREAGDEVLKKIPDAHEVVIQNRAFLREAVTYLASEAGIRQFIDIGTGIPAQGAVHEVARDTATSEVRVVYVDNDPIVLAHARALMEEASDGVHVVEADMRQPDVVLDEVRKTGLINFDEPVAVLFLAMLHFVTSDEHPDRIVDAFRSYMVPGSHVVISHATAERDPKVVGEAAQTYQRATSGVTLRTTPEVRELFTGFELIEPGVVPVAQWKLGQHVDDPDSRAILLGGVGRLA